MSESMNEKYPIFYSREANKMGIILKNKKGEYLEMVSTSNVNDVILYLTESVPLETVNYVIAGLYMIVDLMVFKDIGENISYIFEVSPTNVTVYKSLENNQDDEDDFYFGLTDENKYVIICTVSIKDFQKM